MQRRTGYANRALKRYVSYVRPDLFASFAKRCKQKLSGGCLECGWAFGKQFSHLGRCARPSGSEQNRGFSNFPLGDPMGGCVNLDPLFFENSNNSISGTSNKRNNNAGSLQYYEGGAAVRCYLVILTCWRDLVLGFVLCQQLVNPIVLGIGVGASVGLRRRAGASAACSGRVLTAISSAGVLALIFRAVEHIVWAVGCRIIAQIHLMT